MTSLRVWRGLMTIWAEWLEAMRRRETGLALRRMYDLL